jgi:hypothetical protein
MTYAPVTVAARRVLLNALEALQDHREGLVLVGAQAIYLYTGDTDVAIATTTKDSDIALIPSRLRSEPTLDAAMADSGFSHDRGSQQPGEWSSADELDPPVELLVPESFHEGGGRRGARIPPHSKHAARVVRGVEAAAVSHRAMTIASLEPDGDVRRIEMQVASPAALVVAKAYKIGERATEVPQRLLDKDAHDLYRLLRAISVEEIVVDCQALLVDETAGPVTRQALAWLDELTQSVGSPLPVMAGRAEEFVGDPGDVAQATWALVRDVLDRVGH